MLVMSGHRLLSVACCGGMSLPPQGELFAGSQRQGLPLSGGNDLLRILCSDFVRDHRRGSIS